MLSGARTCARVTDLNLEFQFVMLPADFTAVTAAAAGVAVPAAAAAAAIVTVNPSAAAVSPQPFCCSFVLSISTCSTICLLLSLIFIFSSHSLAKAPSALQPSVFIHQMYIYVPYKHMHICVCRCISLGWSLCSPQVCSICIALVSIRLHTKDSGNELD